MKILLPLFFAAVLPASAAFRTEAGNGSLKVFDGDKLVTEYRTDARTPYLAPLLSPGGATLSRHWPMEKDVAPGEERDHPHHRSFWLSYGDVDGFDFWAWTSKKGEPKIVHKGFSGVKADERSATFTVDLVWTADGTDRLTEKRTYTIRKAEAETTEIELATVMESAGAETLFGDTKEGFCGLRVDRTLRLKGETAKGHIADSEGRTDQDCWGKRSNWVAFTGPDEKGEPAVIAMMDHPSNFRHPSWWHARDYGLLAANPFGIHDFEGKKDKTLGQHVLKKGDKLAFRYLVVLHHGTADSAKLADRWSTFSK
ncbi:PmoA family protein [Luteolibacter ambystomatis]|uniref:PmoA family protein n=1 Tax=Luteolibacter ambystomatis TaxID=2824561 RepID=A0A975G7U2_9BACT|nr:PmoA family protein [Luteolibacter ambystomatis]QUE50408.1 PmoA family protein [Luteolibacter ambystomatis]